MRDTKSQLIIGEAFHQHFNQSTFSDFGIQEDVLLRKPRRLMLYEALSVRIHRFSTLTAAGPTKDNWS
jgi:hypothetical protein